MKKLLLALGLLCGFIGSAQIFAPPGAKWEYIFTSHLPFEQSAATIEYDGDTLFQSLNCQKVGGYIFYSDTYRIFYFNHSTNSFNKIYDYSMNIGDSLYLYHIMWSIQSPECDSGFYAQIIGKGIDNINGNPYRYIEYEEDWEHEFFGGKYYEKLGFLNHFFISQTVCNVFDIPYYGCLRLYTDSSSTDTLVDNRINCPITTDIGEKPATIFYLYPNPTTNGMLTIQSKATIKSIELIDMLGQNVLNAMPIANTINIGAVAQGMYVVKVVFVDGRVGFKRVVVN